MHCLSTFMHLLSVSVCINDSFARLEDQADLILKQLDSLRAAQERYEKEARANFKKILDVNSMLEKLGASKADRAEMMKLLDLATDLELVMTKLDRSEFVAVVQDLEESIERLSIQVKMNEEEMQEGFATLHKELSFKMYTEDFIIATEPIRNRIKAILYEQQKIKDIALQNFFPDAPGVTKCISCKRAANLMSLKWPGPKVTKETGESTDKEMAESPKSAKDPPQIKLPPIDIDEIPIPPADKPRIQDIHQLPVLFANIRPQVGLAHEKRKKDIDKEIATFFKTGKKLYAVGGEHTKTMPLQKGVAFTTHTVPQTKRTGVLLKSSDQKYFRGTVADSSSSTTTKTQPSKDKSESKQNIQQPAPVTLQSTFSRPLPDAKISLPKNKS
ncbi:uncharacterized protein CDAR_508821 [Caerostris darwini]|uniref:DUF4795 domain-containing protein n=1 Tax=Caerostris darwini TaxID=1538125 RepID=A0AAV4N071_9ARAC|nr:uncharacterized protein CDAR_508821 [Caerostris darwini]